MFKTKIILTSIIFTTFLIFTSAVKNKTRIIEKKLTNLHNIVLLKKKDLNESQLDYYYLTSPTEIERRLNLIGFNNYHPIAYSKIFLNISDFNHLQNKLSSLNEKKTKKK